jgi:hypothetical protein
MPQHREDKDTTVASKDEMNHVKIFDCFIKILLNTAVRVDEVSPVNALHFHAPISNQPSKDIIHQGGINGFDCTIAVNE